jgi:hypothetical protein
MKRVWQCWTGSWSLHGHGHHLANYRPQSTRRAILTSDCACFPLQNISPTQRDQTRASTKTFLTVARAARHSRATRTSRCASILHLSDLITKYRPPTKLCHCTPPSKDRLLCFRTIVQSTLRGWLRRWLWRPWRHIHYQHSTPHCAGGGRPPLLLSLDCCGLGTLPNDELRASPPAELLRRTPPVPAAAAPAPAASVPAPAPAAAGVRRLADSPPCCGCCCSASGDSRPAPLLPFGVPNPITTLPRSPACTGLSPARPEAPPPAAMPRPCKLLSPPPKLAASKPPPGVDDM